MEIRKVSIGPDYKSGAMHYIVGQSVLNDTQKIHLITNNDRDSCVRIYIINDKDEIVLWKEFTNTIPVSIEYNINI